MKKHSGASNLFTTTRWRHDAVRRSFRGRGWIVAGIPMRGIYARTRCRKQSRRATHIHAKHRPCQHGLKFGEVVERSLAHDAMCIRAFGERIGYSFPPKYYVHPRAKDRRGIWSFDEPAATVRGVNRPIPPDYKQHRNDVGQAASSRPLTTQERALIQAFPRDFGWSGSATDVEQQIGNAGPPMMAEFVAHRLREILALEGIAASTSDSIDVERAKALHQPSMLDEIGDVA